jgi:phosphoribosylaminoimidazolecarboxamide formyltransferase/IMP cyclohydrolase
MSHDPHAASLFPVVDLQPIRRALVSVSDKAGVVDLGRALAARGVEILSTGGTFKALADAGVPVVQVSAYTGSPEIMGGRVKTLHPRVHGGILMRGDADLDDLAKVGGKPIDLVVVNLYPFESAVVKGSEGAATRAEIVEEIDIGGPSMVRSAAKSHPRVTVVVDPRDYASVLEELENKSGTTLATRSRLAAKAFAHTAAYDGAIARYLSSNDDGYSDYLTLAFEKVYPLRYGENPHQTGAFYRARGAAEGSLARAESLGTGAKELSFNNFVDVQAALEAVRDLDGATPGCVIVKHTNPCGVATAPSLEVAFRTAKQADSVSAFGGIVALNRVVDAATARAMAEMFLECVVAPSFSADALEVLRAKKNLRLLAVGAAAPDAAELDYRRLGGGLAAMSADPGVDGEIARARVVTKRAPTSDELAALDFAWRVTKHVKSNAIVLAKSHAGIARTVGVGAGQMSRVVSVEIALKKAGSEAIGSVLGSDAFFPFADGVEAAIAGGVTAIAQPGGSVKDAEVIAVADAHGLAMVMTGVRHFRH